MPRIQDHSGECQVDVFARRQQRILSFRNAQRSDGNSQNRGASHAADYHELENRG
jgi:hypothetical protein